MSSLSILRQTAFAAAAVCSLTPSIGGGIAAKAAIGTAFTAATVSIAISDAEARPRVQDHRTTRHHSPPKPPPRRR